MKTVRLDKASAQILAELAREMGLPVSTVLKQGLLALRDRRLAAAPSAYEIYRRLDLGPGGYALAPSTATRHGVAAAVHHGQRR